MNYSSDTTGSQYYVQMIPSEDLVNYYKQLPPGITTGDIHICGLCKQTFGDIQSFVLHKSTCGSIDTTKMPPATSPTATSEATVTMTTTTTIDAPVNYIIQDDQLIQLTCENAALPLSIVAQEIPSAEKPEELLQPHHIPSSVSDEMLPPKRDFQVDEEDVASLLANQLPKEVLNSTASSLFPSPDEQNNHIVILHDPNEGKNDICTSNVNGDDDSTPAEISSPKKARIVCSVCGFATKHPNDVARHMRKHTGERPFECNICGRRFSRSDKMQTHKRIHTGEKRYKCQMCNYASVDSGPLRKHLRIHTDERPHKCQICPYRSRDSSQLTVHLRTHTGDCPFVCQVKSCTRAFKTSTDLKRHALVHARNDSNKQTQESSKPGIDSNEPPILECPFSTCDFTTDSAIALQEHSSRVHDIIKLTDEMPQPGSILPGSMNQATLVCPLNSCNFITDSAVALHEHKKAHRQGKKTRESSKPNIDSSNLPTLVCPLNSCDFMTDSAVALHEHNKVHSQEVVNSENTAASPGEKGKKQKRGFYCHICSTNCQYKSKLASHMKKHESQLAVRPICQKSYQCTYCSCAFVRPDSLRSHIKQHQQNQDLNEQTPADIIINDAVVNVTSSLTSDPRDSVIFCVNSLQNGDDTAMLFNEESSSIVMKALDDGSVQYIMLPMELSK